MNGDTGAPTKGESQQPAMQPEKEEMKKSSGIEERQRRCENEVYVSLLDFMIGVSRWNPDPSIRSDGQYLLIVIETILATPFVSWLIFYKLGTMFLWGLVLSNNFR